MPADSFGCFYFEAFNPFEHQQGLIGRNFNNPAQQVCVPAPAAQTEFTLRVKAQFEAAREILAAMFPTHATKMEESTCQKKRLGWAGVECLALNWLETK